MPKNKKTLVILDSNAIIHRSYHALPDFRTPKGDLVNAVYGFASILFKVLREFEPEYIAAAFDVAGPTFRDEEYREYKAKREKAPDELYAQIPLVKKVLEALNISIYEKQGFEADDIIGTIARLVPKKQAHPPIETIIVSGDLDTLQLVDKHTKVYTMRKGLKDVVLYDIAAVKERFGGLSPEQMADYKGLRGDPSDNIPGITGIGEKTAIQLLTDFGNMEKLYEASKREAAGGKAKKLEKYSQRIRNLIRDYKDQAFFSKELATIERGVDINLNIKDLKWKDFNTSDVEELFNAFGFRSLLSRLPEFSAQNTIPPVDEILEKEMSAESLPARSGEAREDPTLGKIEALHKEGVFSKEIYELEKSLIPVIRNMEKEGIKIDKKYFEKLSLKITRELAKVEAVIYKTAKRTFNINSPQQLSETLFNKPIEEADVASAKNSEEAEEVEVSGLGLSAKGLKKTPGGVVSTAAPELEKLRGTHPIIVHLLKYRELQKLYSTYVKPLPQMTDAHDRIHTAFDSLGTITGRISSSKPNLQNIPVKGGWGPKIRKGFITEKGYVFGAFDYSQMELRIAAHIANDVKMKEFFAEDKDIHTMTASEVFGIKPKDITKEMRNRAKALNFGVLYGMGVNGFAKSAGIAREDARAFIDDYFIRFPSIYEYIEKTKTLARKQGYVETILGRRRYLPEITSSTPPLRAQAERMAINHPIQGTAADIIKIAMVQVYGTPLSGCCRLLLQIHDELLFEIKNGKVKESSTLIRQRMERAYVLSVPLKVEVHHGPSWGELHE